MTSPTVAWPKELPGKLEITFGAETVDVFATNSVLKQKIYETVGAPNEHNNVQAGSISFELDNPDSHFTPDHPMSKYWPYVQLGITVKWSVYWLGQWWLRFTGEVSEWKPYWPYGDLSDESRGEPGEARVSVVASGILRRLGQGKSPERSPVYRTMSGLSAGLGGVMYTPLVYIPMEDGSAATQFASGIAGGQPVTPTGPVTFASDGAAGSAPVIRAGAGLRMAVPIPAYTDVGKWAILLAVSIPAEPAATTTLLDVPVAAGGTAARWKLEIVPGANCEIWWRAYDSTGALVPFLGAVIILGGVNRPTEAEFFGEDRWWMLSLTSYQDGANVWAQLGFADGGDWNNAPGSAIVGTHAALSGEAVITVDSTLDGIGIGHFGVFVDAAFDAAFGGIGIGASIGGWAGERADIRLARLCREFGIPFTLIGFSFATMGPQQIDTQYNLLLACANVDVGILFEDRTQLGLKYRCNRSLYNQTAKVTLNARRNELTHPFRPALDDLNVRNDVAVARLGGSEYRSEVKTGLKSVLPAPNGVGRYDERLILNLYTDAQTVFNATWRTWRGTWVGMRYARISLGINAAPWVADAWLLADIGDLIAVTDLPPQHPKTTVETLLRGYNSTYSPKRWDVTVNASPAGPYKIGQAGDGTHASAWAQCGPLTALAAEMKPSDTTITVTPDGALFSTTADLTLNPLELYVDGDVHRVTAISGAGPTQTFTVQRSYPQLRRGAGTLVKVNNPAIAAL